MQNFKVTPEFKTQVTTILSTKKFSAVYPYMNLVKREGFIYTEQDLNSILNFVGEFSYNEVADFFQGLSSQVSEVTAEEMLAETKLEPQVVSSEVEA